MRIGRYEVVREIGRGGMGIVYEAQDPMLARSLALKLIRVDSGTDRRSLNDRLAIEARAAASLTHPNIVTIYDVGVQDDSLYVAMEYVKGWKLQTLMEDPSIDRINLLEKLLPGVASALDYAHQQGVLHRDVKPGNILVREEWTPVLVDFGMAAAIKAAERNEAPHGGTVIYAPTEQLLGEKQGPATDQFSLAAVTYEILTGETPYAAAKAVSGFAAAMAGDYPPASRYNTRLNPNTDAALARALMRDPSSRHTSCSAFAEALLSALRGVPAPPLTPRHAPAPLAPGSPPPAPPDTIHPADAVTSTGGEFNRMFNELRRGGGAPGPSTHAGPFTQAFGTLAAAPPPTGFMDTQFLAPAFTGAKVHFDKIEQTLRFYRDRLSKQYDTLERQARSTYFLWVGCVAVGFGVLITGLVLVFMGKLKEGIATVVSSALVYFIQNIFQQREDQYRKAADQKNEHLEYGNRWLLAIQTIDSVEDRETRAKCQARLAYELTRRIGDPAAHPGAKKKAEPA